MSAVENAQTVKVRTPAEPAGTVDHFYWVRNAEIAAEMGVQVRCLCGRWTFPDGAPRENVVETVVAPGFGVIVDSRSRDCKTCVRALAAARRRRTRA